MGQGRHILSHLPDAGVEGLVLIHAVGGDYLLVRLPAQGDLLTFGQEHELPLPGNRVHGARCREDKSPQNSKFQSFPA